MWPVEVVQSLLLLAWHESVEGSGSAFSMWPVEVAQSLLLVSWHESVEGSECGL